MDKHLHIFSQTLQIHSAQQCNTFVKKASNLKVVVIITWPLLTVFTHNPGSEPSWRKVTLHATQAHLISEGNGNRAAKWMGRYQIAQQRAEYNYITASSTILT